ALGGRSRRSCIHWGTDRWRASATNPQSAARREHGALAGRIDAPSRRWRRATLRWTQRPTRACSPRHARSAGAGRERRSFQTGYHTTPPVPNQTAAGHDPEICTLPISRVFLDGETRTRTGDTTILRTPLERLKQAETPAQVLV